MKVFVGGPSLKRFYTFAFGNCNHGGQLSSLLMKIMNREKYMWKI